MKNSLYRMLPKIDDILNNNKSKEFLKKHPKIYLINSANDRLNKLRNSIKNLDENKISNFNIDVEEVIDEIVLNAKKLSENKLKKVINATGIIIHTNMGRSLLSKDAVKNAFEIACSYNNLELDLDTGKRGSRYNHLENLITSITGAESCHIVNNNASAVMLALLTLAKDKEVIVSRSELVEIGGSFRVPEIMKLSNCKLVEVGCTNKTHLADYKNAITEDTGLLLKVHTSNYKIMGFTETQTVADLSRLAKDNNIPLVEDIGSGSLINLSKFGIKDEPTVMDSIKNGADIVTFSGDKLLGGPQCGIIVGKKKYIDMMKKHQLTRALRVDKVILALLETTIKDYLDEEKLIANNPTINMLSQSDEFLFKKTKNLAEKISNIDGLNVAITKSLCEVGGGSLPMTMLNGYNIVLSAENVSSEKLKTKLREYKVPIITRIHEDRLLIDVRTVKIEEFEIIKKALESII